MLYDLIRPMLFKLDPEKAHHLTIHLCELFNSKDYHFDEKLTSTIKNLTLPGPLGLAAGLDKNAQALNFFSSLGLGAIEAGTVTYREQLGNETPRIWRYPQDQSLRNAMGFPNAGVDKFFENLRSYHSASILGVNIGKNKETGVDESIIELGNIVSKITRANYFTVNVSSPNTPGLRALQEPKYLKELFSHLKNMTDKPIFLKIAPDLDQNQICTLAELACESKIEGIVATNTTIIPALGIGGISGKLLQEKAKNVHSTLLQLNTDLNIICVGGIDNFKSILDIWRQGGRWIQIYTALIFKGPLIFDSINKSIIHFLDKSNIKDLNTFFDLDLKTKIEIIEGYEKKYL